MNHMSCYFTAYTIYLSVLQHTLILVINNKNEALALAVGQMASHLTLEYFGILRSSWWTQWLQGAQVLWLQNKPKSSALHSWCEVFVLTCCVWFSPNVLLCVWPNYLHFDLISPNDKSFQKSSKRLDVALGLFLQFLWALHGQTLGWDVHSWEDWQLSGKCSTFEWFLLTVEWWTPNSLEMAL